jgi:hypothetical protein
LGAGVWRMSQARSKGAGAGRPVASGRSLIVIINKLTEHL